MALDIYSYSFIQKTVTNTVSWEDDISEKFDKNGLIENKYLLVEPETDEGRERLHPLLSGEYEITVKSDFYNFRMSYSTASSWIHNFELLHQKLFQQIEYTIDIPFYFQVAFSQIDSAIGPVACSILAKNYENHKKFFKKTSMNLEDPAQFMAVYNDFYEVFRIGSQDGIVIFS